MAFKLTAKSMTGIGCWLASGSVGVSARTIVAIALGARTGDFDIPRDAGDFGRCYKLIKCVPQLADALPLVAQVCPKWQPVVDNWTELCALYERDIKELKHNPRRGRLCTNRLYAIHDDCMISDGYTKVGCSWRK